LCGTEPKRTKFLSRSTHRNKGKINRDPHFLKDKE